MQLGSRHASATASTCAQSLAVLGPRKLGCNESARPTHRPGNPLIPHPSPLTSMPAGPQTSRPSTLGSLLHSPQPAAPARHGPGSPSQAPQAGLEGPAAASTPPAQAHQLPLLPSPVHSPSGGHGPRPLSATLHSAAAPPVVTIKPSVPLQQPGAPFGSLASLAQAYQPHAPAQVCAGQWQRPGVRHWGVRCEAGRSGPRRTVPEGGRSGSCV